MKNPLTAKCTLVAVFSVLVAAGALPLSSGAVSLVDADGRARIDHFALIVTELHLETAESAAKGLFAAWQANDRTSAAKYATKKAIDYLFDPSNSRDKYQFESCSRYSGAMHCWYRNDDGGSLNLTMIKAGKSWKVNSMEFVDIS